MWVCSSPSADCLVISTTSESVCSPGCCPKRRSVPRLSLAISSRFATLKASQKKLKPLIAHRALSLGQVLSPTTCRHRWPCRSLNLLNAFGMRLKAKHVTLGLLAQSGIAPPREVPQQLPTGLGAAPFRLVPAGAAGAAQPAAQSATQPASVQARIPSDQTSQREAKSQLRHPATALRQQSDGAALPQARAAEAAAQPTQQQQQQASGMPSPPKLSAAGRPVRKRKANSLAEDMVSTEEVMRRGGRRPKPAPAEAVPSAAASRAVPATPPFRALPPGAQAAGVMRAAAAIAAGLPALQLVSLPVGDGSTAIRVALPAAALLAMPHLLRSPAGQGPASPVHAGAMPFRLVAPDQPAPPPGQPAPTSTADGESVQQQQQQQDRGRQEEVPAVRVADPRDIASIARQLEEEEQRRALAAAATARVALRVLPGTQVAAQGSRGAASKPPVPSGRNGKRSRGSMRPSRPLPEPSGQTRPASLPPGTWHPGFECLGGVTYVSAQQGAAAAPPPAVAAGVPPRFAEAAAAAAQSQQPEVRGGACLCEQLACWQSCLPV